MSAQTHQLGLRMYVEHNLNTTEVPAKYVRPAQTWVQAADHGRKLTSTTLRTASSVVARNASTDSISTSPSGDRSSVRVKRTESRKRRSWDTATTVPGYVSRVAVTCDSADRAHSVQSNGGGSHHAVQGTLVTTQEDPYTSPQRASPQPHG